MKPDTSNVIPDKLITGTVSLEKTKHKLLSTRHTKSIRSTQNYQNKRNTRVTCGNVKEAYLMFTMFVFSFGQTHFYTFISTDWP